MDKTRMRPSFELVSFLHPDNPPGVHPGNLVVNDDLHLIHTIGGSGATEMNGRSYAMKPGVVVFIAPFTEYAVRCDVRRGLEMLNVHFHLFADRGMPITQLRRLPPLFRPTNFSRLERDLRRWHTQWLNGDAAVGASVTARLHGLAATYWTAFGEPVSAQTRDAGMEQLAQRLMRKDAVVFDADRLAAELFMSVSQMNRRFRRARGVAPKDFWLKHRFARARSALHYGTQPIARIAAELGFEDANYFSRWFKKMSGLSPAAYRRRSGASGASEV